MLYHKTYTHLVWQTKYERAGDADEKLSHEGYPVLHALVHAILEARERDQALHEGAGEGEAGRGQDGPTETNLVDYKLNLYSRKLII